MQLKRREWFRIFGKGHQTRHLDFCLQQLLTEGLQTPRSIGVGSACDSRHQLWIGSRASVCQSVFRSNFGPVQEGDCATFSAVSDTRCSTYLIFTAFLTAERSTIELPGSGTDKPLYSKAIRRYSASPNSFSNSRLIVRPALLENTNRRCLGFQERLLSFNL